MKLQELGETGIFFNWQIDRWSYWYNKQGKWRTDIIKVAFGGIIVSVVQDYYKVWWLMVAIEVIFIIVLSELYQAQGEGSCW